ncbi:MAG: DUF4198 domain-containing protein [Gammaproteobacteria bacterium]|nr:DUF4198 domain-containing protein [Gammaproteobacteria bacterium]
MRIKAKTAVLFFLGTFGINHLTYAELLWNPKPVKEAESKIKSSNTGHEGHAGHQQNRSKEKAFYLEDNQNSTARYITPGLEVIPLTAEEKGNKYILPKTGMDNYHALVAERKTESTHESALRYPYMRGKPSGHSPDKLVSDSKLPLEIVPEPMIREHWRFYSSNKHDYKVLFEEKPLKDTWVILQTSNGSKMDAKTDGDGKVNFTLPEDFQDIKPGRRANKPAEFILRTVHISDGITYKTNFSAPYSVNPSHWNSNLGGILSLSVGFLSGIVIMRRHNNKMNEEKKNNKNSRRAS